MFITLNQWWIRSIISGNCYVLHHSCWLFATHILVFLLSSVQECENIKMSNSKHHHCLSLWFTVISTAINMNHNRHGRIRPNCAGAFSGYYLLNTLWYCAGNCTLNKLKAKTKAYGENTIINERTDIVPFVYLCGWLQQLRHGWAGWVATRWRWAQQPPHHHPPQQYRTYKWYTYISVENTSHISSPCLLAHLHFGYFYLISFHCSYRTGKQHCRWIYEDKMAHTLLQHNL